MIKPILNLLIALYIGLFSANAQTSILKSQINKLVNQKDARVGVSIKQIETADTLTMNGNGHFPMQSVFKFHIALAVLHQVDLGKLSLNQLVTINKSELLQNTWSPLRDEHTEKQFKLPLHEIIRYMVSHSDNNACDILLSMIGGPNKVEQYITSLGYSDIKIVYNEEKMQMKWENQFSNWTTPVCATQLLCDFYSRNNLSIESFTFLWDCMTTSSTGIKRLKNQLPKGIEIAHKTGSSGVSENGITAAVNDIGIITLPNGNHLIISVFVSDSKENNEVNEKIVADIGKAAYDYFTANPK